MLEEDWTLITYTMYKISWLGKDWGAQKVHITSDFGVSTLCGQRLNSANIILKDVRDEERTYNW